MLVFLISIATNAVIFQTNVLAKYQLATQCAAYEQLEDQLVNDEDAYARQVCAWLNQSFSHSMYKETSQLDQIRDKLIQILSTHTQVPISAVNEINELAAELIECLPGNVKSKCGLKTDGDSRGALNMRSIIKFLNLPFILSNKKDKQYFLFENTAASDSDENSV